ncbi:MAG TPA: hypothetical protein VMU87_03770 [Stellaceae bacterium]|nr:hypothetical protein [Stellaceae bacterium]
MIDPNDTKAEATEDAAAPAPEESAVTLFRALVRHHAEGRIALSFDYARLHHMDCPVAVEADSNLFAYAVMALVLLALWRAGWWAAGATLAAGVALYFTAGRYYVRRRIRRRIEERALGSRDLWQRLWRFGGIGLLPADGSAPCVAPEGNWMALVRRLGTTTAPNP